LLLYSKRISFTQVEEMAFLGLGFKYQKTILSLSDDGFCSANVSHERRIVDS
jgi:hypothetical protein